MQFYELVVIDGFHLCFFSGARQDDRLLLSETVYLGRDGPPAHWQRGGIHRWLLSNIYLSANLKIKFVSISFY